LEALEGRALLATADIQPFVNAVLRNAFARELAARHALPVLLGFIGRQAGNPGYLQFLDFNRDGVISRGGGPARPCLSSFQMIRPGGIDISSESTITAPATSASRATSLLPHARRPRRPDRRSLRG